MKNTILEKLKEIEEQKGVEILFACESGSRLLSCKFSEIPVDPFI